MIQTESTNCTDSHIVDLPKLLHMPSFPQERLSTKCYMYKYSTDDSMRLYRYNPTARFSHVGGAYRPTEVIFVQFYEPTKNPNRVLFFNESLEGLGIKEMDQWKESERRAGTSIDVMRQILPAYPESDISVQYEVVHRKSIDAKNVWNYFGPFPRYIESTELSITHNDALDRGRNHLVTDPNTVLGTIHVTPNNFKKRIITEKRDTTLLSVFGNIGGVASIIFAVYAFLFGTKPVGPWGIVQKTSWVKHQKQKKLKQLEDSFNISKVQGVPLVTPVHQRYAEIYSKNAPSDEKIQQVNEELSIMELGVREAGDDSSSRDVSDLKYRMEQMEGRNQMLELILKAYYVDDEIFQQLNKARAEGGDTYANRLSSQSTCNFESHLLKQSYH